MPMYCYLPSPLLSLQTWVYETSCTYCISSCVCTTDTGLLLCAMTIPHHTAGTALRSLNTGTAVKAQSTPVLLF